MKKNNFIFYSILGLLLLGNAYYTNNSNVKADVNTSNQNNINTTLNSDYNSNNDMSLLDKQFNNNYGFSHFTRYNLEHMQDVQSQTLSPNADFSKSKISDINVVDNRKGVKGQKMDVWDSWPLQDSNGNVVDYKGYHVTFALTGNPNKDYSTNHGQAVQDSRIFMYYQKIGQENQGVKSWHNAGPVFLSRTEGTNGRDAMLNNQLAQWSGETVMTNDNDIRLFYTTFDGTQGDNWQALATAKLNIKKTKSGLAINHKKNTDHKTIATPDGKLYQKLSQSYNDAYDENSFRDVHYFTNKGKKYLTFSASTGPKSGPEGSNIINNTAYLGGDSQFQIYQHKLLDNPNDNPWYKPATEYNATLGVVELNNDYSVKKMQKPLLGLNGVTDEFERPNIFKHNGKWYLFGISRGYKLATSNVNPSDSFLIGFVSDSPFGPYKPLNNNGLVIRNSEPWSSRTYNYSFYVLNNKNNKDNNFLVTSYMTNAKQQAGHMTFAPTMQMNINNDQTTINKNKLYPQGTTTK